MPGNIPSKVWLFRMVHYENLAYLFTKGLYASTHPGCDPDYVFIGDSMLTDQRREYPVPLADGGHLGEYVAFYFGQLSPMLLNIKTGWRGIVQRAQRDIVYFCCSLDKVEQVGCEYIFTDGHAKDAITQYYRERSDLDQVDWNTVYKRYWHNDETDQDRQRRKQAELLVRGQVPRECLERIIVYDQEMQEYVSRRLENTGLNVDIYINPDGKFYY